MADGGVIGSVRGQQGIVPGPCWESGCTVMQMTMQIKVHSLRLWEARCSLNWKAPVSNQLFAERYWVGAKEDWTGNQKMCSMHDMCRYNMYVLSMCMATHLLISAAPHKHTHTRAHFSSFVCLFLLIHKMAVPRKLPLLNILCVMVLKDEVNVSFLKYKLCFFFETLALWNCDTASRISVWFQNSF